MPRLTRLSRKFIMGEQGRNKPENGMESLSALAYAILK